MTPGEELAQLRAARTALLSGKAIAQVRHSSGKATAYHPADVGALNSQIETLEAQIRASTTPAPRAIRVRF